MTFSYFRYFQVGVVPVKIEYDEDGARAAYVYDDAKKDFKIDNLYLSEIEDGDEVEELTVGEFEKLL